MLWLPHQPLSCGTRGVPGGPVEGLHHSRGESKGAGRSVRRNVGFQCRRGQHELQVSQQGKRTHHLTNTILRCTTYTIRRGHTYIFFFHCCFLALVSNSLMRWLCDQTAAMVWLICVEDFFVVGCFGLNRHWRGVFLWQSEFHASVRWLCFFRDEKIF